MLSSDGDGSATAEDIAMTPSYRDKGRIPWWISSLCTWRPVLNTHTHRITINNDEQAKIKTNLIFILLSAAAVAAVQYRRVPSRCAASSIRHH